MAAYVKKMSILVLKYKFCVGRTNCFSNSATKYMLNVKINKT